tara:strand:+ start:53 stop:295 length:243 start_codon:yes stop_codon:yes gene_type:complete
MNKKTVTKHDLVRAVKELATRFEFLQRQVVMIDNVVDCLIRMNKDEDKLEKFINSEMKKRNKDAQDTEHKQSGRSATTSK